MLAGWLRGEYENLYATPMDDLSLVYRAEPFHLPGDDLMLAGSLHRVVEALAERLDVRCGRRVTGVFSSPVAGGSTPPTALRSRPTRSWSPAGRCTEVGAAPLRTAPAPATAALGRIGAGLWPRCS